MNLLKSSFIAMIMCFSLYSLAQLEICDKSIDTGLKSLRTAENGSFRLKMPKNHEINARYQFKRGKIWGLAGIAVGSFLWYAKERYEFQGRRFFEIKWGVDEYGFWGSKSHIRVKDKIIKDDFYHVANSGGKYMIIGASFTFGISSAKQNRKFSHYLFDALIIGATSVTFSALGDRALDLTR